MNEKGNKDRVVPFPQTFKEVLAMHISAAEKKKKKKKNGNIYSNK